MAAPLVVVRRRSINGPELRRATGRQRAVLRNPPAQPLERLNQHNLSRSKPAGAKWIRPPTC